MIEIYSIVYQPEQTPLQASTFNRVPVAIANLIANFGIEGDRKAGRNPNRQINILSYETLEQMRLEGFNTTPGAMGEQIIIKGVDVITLKRGDYLQIGDKAILEITIPRTGCEWLGQLQNKTVEETKLRLGVFAKVIASGMIRVGDLVNILEPVI